jgi:hypothetical protein
VHQKGAAFDHRRRALANALVEALDLDMREFWQADVTYGKRLPRRISCGAGRVAGSDRQEREAQRGSQGSMRHAEKVRAARRIDQALAGAVCRTF